MGIRYRKSKKIGPIRLTVSKSGLSASIGVKGLRVTRLANGRLRTTASIPGTGISYVIDEKSNSQNRDPETKSRKGCLGKVLFAVVLVFLINSIATTGNGFYSENNSRHLLNVSDVVLPTTTITPRVVAHPKEDPAVFIAEFKEDFEAAFPNGYNVTYDNNAVEIIVSIYISEEEYRHFYEEGLYYDDVSDWYATLYDVEGILEPLQRRASDAGINRFKIMILLAREHTDEVLAAMMNGKTLYDKIDVLAQPLPEAIDSQNKGSSKSYILNTSTKVFHRPTCSSVNQISEKNKAISSQSRSSVIADGYKPCSICNP